MSSIFIDESGSKNSSGGFFVVGFVKSRTVPALARDMRDVRQKHQHFKEAKFGQVSKGSLPFYFDLVEMLAASDVRIGGSVYDANRHFGSDDPTWLVQARMSSQLVLGNLNRGELLNVFVDLVETPRGESVAKRIHDNVNGTLMARSVVASYDMDSRSTDLLQLADIVAGSIAYERRQGVAQEPGLKGTPKAQVAARLRRAFGLDSFDDVQKGQVNILTMKGQPRTLPGLEV
ncbi:DUF3800 domain-containing protein [Tessaracoccus caeni]|uniref:DUF3800 domain-containing protein n=1 Tax=Tessaracoccus caeni TaxID=3031239 RepID=UPI0023DAA5B2|nr:DUF3800 domain-containing protein [Tessaracoccus caeni]MDF1486919.1 DUF3800 domain-containing protein [Tessaracoccus caeni]